MDTRANAVKIVDDWLRIAFPEAVRANTWQLNRSGFSSAFIGWCLRLRKDVSLLIAVDQFFPYTKPVTAFFGPGAPRHGPHIEADGRLCLVASETTTDSLDPAGVVGHFLAKASSLLVALDRGELGEDYVVDFEAYWSRSRTTGQSVQTLFDIAPPTRSLFLGTYASQRIVSDDEERLRRWLQHRLGEVYKRDFDRSLFLWMDNLPVPSAYPKSYSDLRTLFEKADQASAFDEVQPIIGSGGVVLLGGPSSPGRTAGGAVILSSGEKRRENKGFRPGRTPAALLPFALKLNRASIRSVDAAASRIPLSQLTAADSAHIAIIGCGSLGAGAAKLLAQQGIKHFSLFDPDNLGWENIGRHELGARHVGANKADALKATLLADLPDIVDIASYGTDWRNIIDNDQSVFENVSVIISATGDWGASAALSDLQAAGVLKIPVIYTWLERNAIAAHVVVLQGPTVSLRNGFDNTGRPLTAAASWWSEDQDPRCGGAASPYGAIDLAAGQSLVARAALDIASGSAVAPIWRVWVGLSSDLEQAGGFWSAAFKSIVGDPAEGGKMMAAQWRTE
ncbi:ThiF family adenylyltransferase [Novosphingobium lindaniclasticum]|uniref:ThiF family adenylyltransferase n=1 Tax=Novosphingobium lindaniclasticum TaxID=1329895 RepID=UPI0003F4DAD5|nr:ThiF family adenylyltransferase [Novosphingobium lindaniclasticum]